MATDQSSNGGGGGPIEGREKDEEDSCDNTNSNNYDNDNPAGACSKESQKTSIDNLEDLEKLVLEDDKEKEEGGGNEEEEGNGGDEEKNKKEKEVKLEDDFVDEEAMKLEEEKLTPEDIAKRVEAAKRHKDAGNDEFKQEKYRESILSYTKGLLSCPLCEKELRSILYGNRGAAKIKLGYKELAVMDCTKSLEYNPDYMKALIRRAALFEELDKLDEALEDYQKILKLDPSYRDALIATKRLPPLIHERNEKLKAEMLGKLKDLGNMVLRPFGLSTENFQLQQQEGGGYSINFKK